MGEPAPVPQHDPTGGAVPSRSFSGARRCPWCRDDLLAGAALDVCAGCLTIYHRACVAEAGPRCGTLGCGRRVASWARRWPRWSAAAAAALTAAAVGAATWTSRPVPPSPSPPPSPRYPGGPLFSAVSPSEDVLDLWLPAATQGSTVIVQGWVRPPGLTQITVLGPRGQRLAWEAEAATELMAAILLPEPGLRVIAEGPWGRRDERRLVRRIP